MMYGEFMNRMKQVNGDDVKEISLAEYQVIEHVYNYHPRYEPYDGKLLAAKDYSRYGITFFFELLPIADRIAELGNKVYTAQEATREAERIAATAAANSGKLFEEYIGAKKMFKERLEGYIEEIEAKITTRRY